MKETKISLLRNFGTEQFSITFNLGENPTKDAIGHAIDSANGAVFKMLQDTEARAIQEREVLANSAKARTESLEKLEKELKAETEAKKNLAKTTEVAIKNYSKMNK